MKLITIAGMLMVICSGIYGQTSESFNTRPGIPHAETLNAIEANCWNFFNLAVTNPNSSSIIEGNGSISAVSSSQVSTLYTPVLSIRGETKIALKYKAINASESNHQILLFLTDFDNNIILSLDSILINGQSSEIETYSRHFPSLATGQFKIQITFKNSDGKSGIVIDDLVISSSVYYKAGCNTAPVADSDSLWGKSNRTASGSILQNDHDADNETITPYIIRQSPHGSVTINSDNSFHFSPNEGFTGDKTSFTYQVCDNGFSPLCSEEIQVTIYFPSASMVPVSLIDFNGIYQYNGRVLLRWTTNFESNSSRFEIERSLNGTEWVNIGSVQNKGTSGNRNSYSFEDDAGKRIALKKDLYYRLKQVDLNGSVAVSRLLLVRVYNSSAVKMVSVTPNPAVNDIAVTIELNEEAIISMKVRSSSGIEVNRKIIKAAHGIHQYILEGTSTLKPGLYILEVIINSKERMIVKLIKD